MRRGVCGNPADTDSVSTSTPLTAADAEHERIKLRTFISQLAFARKVYARNPAALALVKMRVGRIRDRMAYLDRRYPAA